MSLDFFSFDAGKEYKSSKYDKISLRCFTIEELERATKNFSQDCLLGSGAFCNVYKGIFELEGILAIKRPHSESFLSVEEFRNGQPQKLYTASFTLTYTPQNSHKIYIFLFLATRNYID